MSLRLLVLIVEGKTERQFVKKVLSPYFGARGVNAKPIMVSTSKDKHSGRFHRGGFRRTAAYPRVKADLTNALKEFHGPDIRFTTMFDLYGLPEDFPGYAAARGLADPYARVKALEQALAQDLGDWRFVPYLQLHEFEALVFVDPQRLDGEYLEHDAAIARLKAIAAATPPELIDDGPETAPSKRILAEISEYDKANAGPLVVEKIGLTRLRERCPHFHEWLATLERL